MTEAYALPGLAHLPADRCLVMGVLNVTPDSFSDGGEWLDPEAAVRHGLDLVADGADVVDVGGESTRPGAERVTVEEECRRVLPVVRDLAAAGVCVSIDTSRASVAAAALRAGAVLVNDVTGGTDDAALPRLVAETGVAYVVMHSRGPSADMQSRAVYADVVAEVRAELVERCEAVVAAGVRPEQIVLDPGIGFAKDAGHNLALISRLDAFVALGRPVLVGASRKTFLGTVLGGRDVHARDDATTAVTALAAAAGVWGVRVHAAKASADAVRVVAAVRRGAVG